MIYKLSAGHWPKYAKNITFNTNVKNKIVHVIFFFGSLELWNGKVNNIIIAIPINIIPLVFDGVTLNIVYNGKKYHSGTMCGGVSKGLAGTEFIGSINFSGSKYMIYEKKNKSIVNANQVSSPNIGVKLTFQLTLSFLLELDPLSCNTIKWIKTITVKNNPNKKWIVKKRFKVVSHTLKPPQIKFVKGLPIKGIIEKKLVITIAAQKDICPQGNT